MRRPIAKRLRAWSNRPSTRRAGCGYQDSASHFTPLDKIFPLILILPLKLPISFTLSVWMGTSLATGFPCFVMIMPSGPTRSSRARHCSLNRAAGTLFIKKLYNKPEKLTSQKKWTLFQIRSGFVPDLRNLRARILPFVLRGIPLRRAISLRADYGWSVSGSGRSPCPPSTIPARRARGKSRPRGRHGLARRQYDPAPADCAAPASIPRSPPAKPGSATPARPPHGLAPPQEAWAGVGKDKTPLI